MQEQNTIMVPWDFTDKADAAFQHALMVSSITGAKINLLHIVKKKKEEGAALAKMQQVAVELEQKYGSKPDVTAMAGSIFKTIGQAADLKNAELVIMGTHGIRGMQKLTGSWALKVIVSSKAPFVVVQGPPKNDTFKHIVFPVDFKKENKEKLRWIEYLAKHYNFKIHLLRPVFADERLKKKSDNNLLFVRNYLSEQGIDFTVDKSKESNFAEGTIAYAKETNADLILIMTTKNIGFSDYVMGASEQQIIANSAQIPVMCVNPRKIKVKYRGFNG
jgi:nucleotide-binding universal stress UspA family protein